MLIQAAISRSREFAADQGAAQIVGSPYGLADALRKIESGVRRVPTNANPATAHMFIMKPFSGRGMMALFSHASTDRAAHPTSTRLGVSLAGGNATGLPFVGPGVALNRIEL